MRLLVVEDYMPLQKSLLRALASSGYAVDATADGEEALWYINNNNYDLMIVDIMLPKCDGYEIIQHTRGLNKQTAIIALSARDTVEDQIKGLDLGADDYMTKPFVVEELLARIRSLLRRAHSQRSPLIQWHNLQCDTNLRRVSIDKQAVDLSAREYTLFEYLLLQRGRLVTRDELWEHLYDFNAEINSNVIDQWIARIRKKITSYNCANPIETVRGQGYIFASEEVP
ncbi:MAG: response regulator transcription factor [Planctomycetes bacterium]|nr:response regulator transcription factor [Planctomycetota bacterium]